MENEMSGLTWRKVRTALAVGLVALIFGWLYAMVLISSADHPDLSNFTLFLVAVGCGFAAMLLVVGILGANGYAMPERLFWRILLVLGIVGALHLIGSYIPVRDVQLFTLYAPVAAAAIVVFGLFMRRWLIRIAEEKEDQRYR